MEDQLELLKQRFIEDPSLETMNQIIELDPSKESYFERAVFYINQFDYENALDDLDKTKILLEEQVANHEVEPVYKDGKYFVEADPFENFRFKLVHAYDHIYSITKDYEKLGFYHYENKSEEDVLEYINYLSGDDESTLSKIAFSYFYIQHYPQAKEVYSKIIENYPDNINAYLFISEICYKNEEYLKAIDCLERALKIDPEIVPVLFDLALNYEKVDLTKALYYYNKVLELDNTDSDAYLNRGIINYFTYDKVNEALDDYNNALKHSPNSLLAYNARGSLFIDLGRYSLAMKDFTTCLQLDDTFARGYIKKAEAMLKQPMVTNYEEILNLLNKGESLDSTIFFTNIFQAIVYEKTQQYDLAVATYKRSIEQFNDPAVAILLAKCYVKHGNKKDAKELLEQYGFKKYRLNFSKLLLDYYVKDMPSIEQQNRLTRSQKHRISSMHEMAEYLYLIGNCDEAIDLYDVLIKRNKNDAKTCFYSGCMYQQKGDTKKAIKQYKEAIKRNKALSPAYNNMGIIYYLNKDYKKAITIFEKAIKNCEDCTDPYYNIGMVYFELKRHKIANEYYTKYITLTNNEQVYFERGRNQYFAGEYQEAISDMEKCIEIDHEVAQANLIIGSSYFNQGMYQQAKPYYERCIEHPGASPKNIQGATKKLKEIQDLESI